MTYEEKLSKKLAELAARGITVNAGILPNVTDPAIYEEACRLSLEMLEKMELRDLLPLGNDDN